MKIKLTVALLTVCLLVVTGTVYSRVKCPPCKGSGERTCTSCSGSGYKDHPNDSRFVVGCTNCGGSGSKHKTNPVGNQGFKAGRGVMQCSACGGLGTQPD